jgi:hypothetical protein
MVNFRQAHTSNFKVQTLSNLCNLLQLTDPLSEGYKNQEPTSQRSDTQLADTLLVAAIVKKGRMNAILQMLPEIVSVIAQALEATPFSLCLRACVVLSARSSRGRGKSTIFSRFAAVLRAGFQGATARRTPVPGNHHLVLCK